MNHRFLIAAGIAAFMSGCAIDAAQVATPPAADSAPATRVSVTYDAAITDSFTGRVYLMTTEGRRPPRLGPGWFGTTPFFAVDVVDWRPQTPLVFNGGADGFPESLDALTGEHKVQAVMRIDQDYPTVGSGPGSAYSKTVELTFEAGSSHELHIDQVVPPESFQETDRIKLVEFRSQLLSDFHDRDITMRAAVILPVDFEASSADQYPVYYWITGFGGSHQHARFKVRSWDASEFADRIVRIIPDPRCHGGHHVFADSANNGPWSTALTTELIPFIEQTYGFRADKDARFLGGHSSGGWSSLWLQVTNPQFFGGTWSVAPDPVEFQDFQQIDLYADGANAYHDEAGERRPVARRNGQPVLWYDDFSHIETIMGEGGQLRSFEWVFSPRGTDGLPRRMYDRTTGAVDPDVAQSWTAYDIGLYLERNWSRLRAPLAGRLHVFMGSEDTFYLDGATRLLKKRLARLGSDAVIEIVEGADHGSIATPELAERVDQEIIETFDSAFGESSR